MTRTALVTGGSRGIGQAIAVALAAAGHAVVATGRDTAALAQTVALADGALSSVACDVNDLDAVRDLVPACERLTGSAPSVVVNCAGIVRAGRITSLTRADWEESMRVNVQAPLELVQAAVPAMLAGGWGRIVNIGSMYSRVAPKYAGAYAVSKHALLGLTRTMSAEFAPRGITVNAVLPGWTETDMFVDEATRIADAQGTDYEAAVLLMLRNQPLKRVIAPAEVGALVAFLCSDAAAAITGQGLNIDGGEIQS